MGSGDGKRKCELLDFLAIDDCSLEATSCTLDIREATEIDIDLTVHVIVTRSWTSSHQSGQ